MSYALRKDGLGFRRVNSRKDILESEVFSEAMPEIAVPYNELRAAAYPSFAEYIDGLVKGDAAQMRAYVDACLAVKAKYPKPK